jgi:hypothetical protein
MPVQDPAAPGPTPGEPAVPVSAGDELLPADTGSMEPPYEDDLVFDQNQLRTFSFNLPDEQWQALRLAARDKDFIPAELTISGESVGTVGIRFKGGYTLDSCFEMGAESTCPKMSLKVKFNEVESEKRWHGMKRINLNAMNADPSYLRERLGYKLANDIGLVSPRSVHARVEINGAFHGLFSLVESVDGRFTDDRYPSNGDGNLYKEAWPQIADPLYYDEFLNTNNDLMPTHAGIIEFSNALDAAVLAGEANLPAVVEQYMDMASLQRYFALDVAVGHWDGVTGFYCIRDHVDLPNRCSNHNFYLYQHEAETRFELIPWDFDAIFIADDYFRIDGVPEWNDPPDECTASHIVFGNIPAEAPSCDPLIRGVALANQSAYVQALREMLDGPYQISALNQSIDTWRAQIASSVDEEPQDAGPGREGWELAIEGSSGSFASNGLRKEIEFLRERISAEHDKYQ